MKLIFYRRRLLRAESKLKCDKVNFIGIFQPLHTEIEL